jgi:glycerol-3-phosphate acyltransferase PlsX
VSAPIRLAVDLMGGDHGPAVTLPACRAFLASHPEAELVLVGRPDAIAQAEGWQRCTRIAASEVVEMHDSLETALRKKKDSSLRVAVNQVKPHADRPSLAQACVSAGNTGALMAVSRYVLKTTRRASTARRSRRSLPNEHDGFTTVLDLGANVDCTAEHLLQFAVMGSALVTAVRARRPDVGLLNIGEEAIKGSEAIKARGELLRERPLPASSTSTATSRPTTSSRARPTRRLRRLRRQRHAEDRRRAGVDAVDVHQQEFKRNALTRLRRSPRCRCSGRFKKRVDPRRYNGAALARPARPRLQEPRLVRFVRVRARAASAYDAAKNGLLDRVQQRIEATLAAIPAASHPSESAAFDDSTAFGGVQSA